MSLLICVGQRWRSQPPYLTDARLTYVTIGSAGLKRSRCRQLRGQVAGLDYNARWLFMTNCRTGRTATDGDCHNL